VFYDDPAHSDHPGWPNDMLIAEERRDSHLMPLVYAHAVWNLGLKPAFADLVVQPQPQPLPGLGADELRHEWNRMYEHAMQARGRIPVADGPADPEMFAKMTRWSRTAPPSIDDRFAAAWDHDAYSAWLDAVAPLEDAIDYADGVLPTLVDAWRTGLRSITVLPLSADFTVRSCRAERIVSHHTRVDPARFAAALRST
jgi:hypothetical protein